jgi:hypothetical protein
LKKLQEQFPVISLLENTAYIFGKTDKLRIFVQRADPELLYRQADNTDGTRSYCGNEKDYRGSREEKACGVAIMPDGSHKIVFRMIWGDRSNRRRVRDGFDSEKVDHVLWITTYVWHKPATEEQERNGTYLGEKVETERIYTVYLAPKNGGFAKLRETADLGKNVELSTHMMMQGVLDHNEEFEQVSAKLSALAHRFENEVYLRGLKKLVQKSKKRGMSGTFDGVLLMSWVMAGRIMVTLEAPSLRYPRVKNSFTVIGCDPPGEARFGWQSVHATLDQATELMNRVIACWATLSDERKAFRFLDSDSVTLDVLAGRKKD